MANDKPKGLLSFLYHVTYNDDVKRKAHENPNLEMQEFNLSGDAMNVLTAMGNDLYKDEETKRKHVDALMKCLGEEILQDAYPIIW